MTHNIEVEGGKTVKLPTAGKYCDRDILVTGNGYTEDDVTAKYDEGKADGITEGKQAEYDRLVDETKIIPATVSGSVLCVNDVSEIPHSCTLSVDKATTVTVFGKNLLDKSQIVIGGLAGATGADWNTNTQMRSDYISVFPKQTYTVSGTSYKVNKIHYYDANMVWLGLKEAATTFETPEKARYVRLAFGDSGSVKTEIDLTTIQEEPLQFERGAVGTAYEPYRGRNEYIIDAGQTVNIDSLCPTMSIFADNDTIIAFGYHKSWGMQMEHDRFWDQALGASGAGNWSYRFAGKGWTDETFAPTKDIVPMASANGLFQASGVKDVKGICERLGVTIDLSNATSVNTFFADSWVEHFGIMDLRGVNTLSSAPLFNAYSLISVDKIILKDDGSQTISNFANNCRSLVDIEFEGVVGASISFQWSTLLTKASIESIMAALSTTTSGLSATFSKTAVNNAFTDEEWATLANTRSNWTINLV